VNVTCTGFDHRPGRTARRDSRARGATAAHDRRSPALDAGDLRDDIDGGGFEVIAVNREASRTSESSPSFLSAVRRRMRRRRGSKCTSP